MPQCTQIEKNKEVCVCKKVQCPNHGKCCDCVAHHRDLGNYPACLRYEE